MSISMAMRAEYDELRSGMKLVSPKDLPCAPQSGPDCPHSGAAGANGNE
ncbi:MAG: hypothetical protein JOZ69_04400 [Myxococcales bacterium]|nr:hypothetical protein [Myxococcales bacterium]